MDDIVMILQSMTGVNHVLVLDRRLLDELRTEESKVKAVMNIGVRNDGFSEAIMREHVICVIKDSRFRPPPEPTVVLMSDTGQVMGREVFPHQRKDFEDRKDVLWLTPDFAVFTNIDGGNKEFFIMPPVSFPELHEEVGCQDVVSCSPSPTSDLMIKQRFGLDDDPNLASIIVGFNSFEN